ncbi:MAG: hypothetical protein U9P88_00210 [Patescibacteria group bacterium]|nr:hypothetical protein [Patescibacteria group bacterium]
MEITPDKYQEPIKEKPFTSNKEAQIEKKIPVFNEQEILKVEKKKELIEKEKIKSGIEFKKNNKRETVQKKENAPTSSPTKINQQIKKLKKLDRQNQVKKLCDLSFQNSLDFVIKIAKGLDNDYVLDEFHDTLVDKLREKLIKSGKLKEL